jgi:Ca2+-binding EF-hand superfamily protein
MKTICIFVLAGFIITSSASFVYSAGPSGEFARNAFKQILSQADTDKDGKLSVSECKRIYKDAAIAEKNCTYWDVDHDGTITEDEYSSQAMSMGKKK